MKKKQELPKAPEFFQDPTALEGKEFGLDFGKALSTLNFEEGGQFENLQRLIDLDPEQTRLALESARGFLQPGFDRQRTQTRNELANFGALTGSGATDAFAQQDFDLNSQLQGITSAAALDDRQRALQNAFGLVGLGSNQVNTSTQFGFQNQGDVNQFRQQNFNNLLGLSKIRQQESAGGFSGGLQGALGGALGGFALGGPVGAVLGGLGGGLSGGFGSQGVGGNIFSGGAGIAGASFLPGSTAGAGKSLGNRNIDFPKISFPQIDFPQFSR